MFLISIVFDAVYSMCHISGKCFLAHSYGVYKYGDLRFAYNCLKSHSCRLKVEGCNTYFAHFDTLDNKHSNEKGTWFQNCLLPSYTSLLL